MSQNIDYHIASTELILKDIGERLAAIRLAQNISQQDLAEKSGLTRRTLSRLENGQGATLDSVVRVLRSLGMEEHLQAFLPNPDLQPMQRLHFKQQDRKRASSPASGKTKAWSWDEEQTP